MKPALPWILWLAAVPLAHAQSEAGPPPGGPRHDMLFFAGSELERERVVQGAPYCADAVHETVQVLADGNRIVQRQQTRSCRDAQGRTRQEVTRGQRRHVYLRDPVTQEAWLLDTEAKRATRLDGFPRGLPMGAPAAQAGWEDRLREWGREMREWGRGMKDKLRAGDAPPPPPAPPVPEVSADVSPQAVRIVIGTPGSELPPPGAGVGHPFAFHARMRGPRGAGVVTPLPAETIEGLKAEGKRTTWTLEAGKIGNEKPIVTTREVWTSPELLITLRSREVDPVVGEDHYRVQNVTRAEPDAQLFRVPDDYRRVTHGMGPRGRP
jgi:hypothetical protein